MAASTIQKIGKGETAALLQQNGICVFIQYLAGYLLKWLKVDTRIPVLKKVMYKIELITVLNAKLNMDPINGLKFVENNDVKG